MNNNSEAVERYQKFLYILRRLPKINVFKQIQLLEDLTRVLLCKCNKCKKRSGKYQRKHVKLLLLTGRAWCLTIIQLFETGITYEEYCGILKQFVKYVAQVSVLFDKFNSFEEAFVIACNQAIFLKERMINQLNL